MNIILLGPPGAGKGTQARRLSELLRVPHIASGDLFRAMGHLDTPEAREVRSYMDRGAYVPDELTIEIVFNRLREADAQSGFLLDGFPRTVPQAEALDQKMERQGRRVDLALNVTVGVDTLLERIAGRLVCPNCKSIYNVSSNPPVVPGVCDVCGHRLERRADETPEVVSTRMVTYENQTRPVINYYLERGVLREVNGGLPMEQVNAEIDRLAGLGTVAS